MKPVYNFTYCIIPDCEFCLTPTTLAEAIEWRDEVFDNFIPGEMASSGVSIDAHRFPMIRPDVVLWEQAIYLECYRKLAENPTYYHGRWHKISGRHGQIIGCIKNRFHLMRQKHNFLSQNLGDTTVSDLVAIHIWNGVGFGVAEWIS